MKQIKKNIVGATEQVLIASSDQATDVVEVTMLYITNTYGADITVSIYIEYVNVEATITAHGPLKNHDQREKETYHLIKSLVIPSATAVNLVDYGVFSFQRPFSLKMSLGADETADVIVEYEDRKGAVKPRDVQQY